MELFIIALLVIVVVFVIRRVIRNKGGCNSCAKTDCHLCDINIYEEYKRDHKQDQGLC